MNRLGARCRGRAQVYRPQGGGATKSFNMVSWVGNGTGARTIAHDVDLTTGGYVEIISNSATPAETALFSVNGTTVYSKSNGIGFSSTTAINAAYAFGRGTLLVPTSRNATGIVYHASLFKKKVGFLDVMTMVGNGTARTIAHGLGVVPGVMLHCELTTADTGTFYIGPGMGATRYIGASSSGQGIVDVSAWNNTAPTASVFSMGTGSGDGINSNGVSYLVLLFAQDGADIKCGTWTGNNNVAGPSVNLGWEPQYIWTRRGVSWRFDQSRHPGFATTEAAYSLNTQSYQAAGSHIALTGRTGFQITSVNTALNSSALVYPYMAVRKQ